MELRNVRLQAANVWELNYSLIKLFTQLKNDLMSTYIPRELRHIVLIKHAAESYIDQKAASRHFKRHHTLIRLSLELVTGRVKDILLAFLRFCSVTVNKITNKNDKNRLGDDTGVLVRLEFDASVP